ncbi:hypothetical protein [Kordiimonas sediminis]|uniref:hypothetical protein n=1 Tax=Kordiimonas sediminis TaxID=1735581 RepID=UPI00174C9758|nr:hypothetical protein [Kordiimonas sediminis]
MKNRQRPSFSGVFSSVFASALHGAILTILIWSTASKWNMLGFWIFPSPLVLYILITTLYLTLFLPLLRWLVQAFNPGILIYLLSGILTGSFISTVFLLAKYVDILGDVSVWVEIASIYMYALLASFIAWLMLRLT